jgi:outer membrane protein
VYFLLGQDALYVQDALFLQKCCGFFRKISSPKFGLNGVLRRLFMKQFENNGKNLNGFLLALIAVLGLASGSVVARADEKIATVDMQKAIQNVEAGKQAKAQLEKEFNAKKKDLQAEEAAIRKMIEDFKKQSLVMSDEAKAKKQGELQERGMKFEELKQRSTIELQQKEQGLTQPIVSKLRSLIGEMAKQKGYSLVLEKNENTVLFSQEKDDMTSDVISAYNKKYGKSG